MHQELKGQGYSLEKAFYDTTIVGCLLGACF